MSGERGERGEKGEQGAQRSEWKTYLLGILFTIVMSFAGIVYSNTIDRISQVEIKVDDVVKERNPAHTKFSADIAVLQSNIEDIRNSLDKFDASQEKLIAKMDLLLSGVARDSKRWNDEMDRLRNTQPKGKKQ